MKIKSIRIKNLKRFSDLTVEDIPETAKLIVLVGPNGSGKTSFFEAFNLWYRTQAFNDSGDQIYFDKKTDAKILTSSEWISSSRSRVQIEFHDSSMLGQDVRGKFYFRSAYRNEPDFTTQQINKQQDPAKTMNLRSLIENDTTVSTNYQRLIGTTLGELFKKENDALTVEELRERLIGRIKHSLSQVFPDLNLSDIGNPLQDGSFYFEKGLSKHFHYKNLSAGEKAAFDLILDLIIKSSYFNDAIYCVDEPESHMHTKLQGKVLRELYNLIPPTAQLWISTHSIGMLEEARKIEQENNGTVVFLDFNNKDFDTPEVIVPARINKSIMDKFYELAFGDFANLMLPKRIIFCEGSTRGNTIKNFDMMIYSKIFEQKYPETQFISADSCNELERIEDKLGTVMGTLLKNCKILKLMDRDSRSDAECEEMFSKGTVVLSKRSIECYLLDDSVIKLLCDKMSKSDKLQDCLTAKQSAIDSSINRDNLLDDIKSASGGIVNSLRKILGITQGGNNTNSFLRDTMAPLITEDTDIFKQLEREIFKEKPFS